MLCFRHIVLGGSAQPIGSFLRVFLATRTSIVHVAQPALCVGNTTLSGLFIELHCLCQILLRPDAFLIHVAEHILRLRMFIIGDTADTVVAFYELSFLSSLASMLECF